MEREYEPIKCGADTPRTMDYSSLEDKKDPEIDDREVLRNFLDRFKTWEQLQRPWSGM